MGCGDVFGAIILLLWFCLGMTTFSMAIMEKDEAPPDLESCMNAVIVLSCQFICFPVILLALVGFLKSSYCRIFCIAWYLASFIGCCICGFILVDVEGVDTTAALCLIYGGFPTFLIVLGCCGLCAESKDEEDDNPRGVQRIHYFIWVEERQIQVST